MLGQLLHLGIRDCVQPESFRNHARIGRVDSVHIGTDLAVTCAESGGERHRGRIRAATPERRDLALVGHPLKAGHDHDLVALQLVLNPHRAHFDNARA